ncbi:MarR family winged helix-turn-helix transcriptional regulator [Nitratireductor luteus]|uniref:MarR family winged helix-turn-helix transcriptional regulator n=1 Tax=Nitratireductor luteus TaxID=2976980 RepID=UPI00223F2C39|nr:MarR family transcriptional regulator [Nitratireductor luteus]
MSLDRHESAGYLTNWAARLFARAIDRRLKPLRLSSGYLPVFFALAGGNALTQKQLARAASIEQPTMAATLSRMERDGLIERTPDPRDKRASLISLAPSARDKLEEVVAATRAVNNDALSNLSSDEAEAYFGALKKIIGSLERAAGEKG